MSRRSGGYSSKKRKSFPDWIIYGIVLVLFVWTAYGMEQDVLVPEPPISPELGPMLPSDSPRDEIVLVDVAPRQSGMGTAFSINDKGLWLTARHVVDSCDSVGLRIGMGRVVRVDAQIVQNSDLAVLRSDWDRRPLPADLENQRHHSADFQARPFWIRTEKSLAWSAQNPRGAGAYILSRRAI